MSMYSLYRPRKAAAFSPIPGTQYPRMATCGAPISDAEGGISPCATETLKANPTERCGACKSRLKNASRLRRNAADRKRVKDQK